MKWYGIKCNYCFYYRIYIYFYKFDMVIIWCQKFIYIYKLFKIFFIYGEVELRKGVQVVSKPVEFTFVLVPLGKLCIHFSTAENVDSVFISLNSVRNTKIYFIFWRTDIFSTSRSQCQLISQNYNAQRIRCPT